MSTHRPGIGLGVLEKASFVFLRISSNVSRNTTSMQSVNGNQLIQPGEIYFHMSRLNTN